jgi:hypothetical protein
MTPFIIGAVLVLGALGLFLGSGSQKKKLLQIQGTETSTAKQLADLAADVGKEIGAGSFNQVSEVKGTIECARPLSSELSGTSCVYYSMSVTREYEETYWETDSQGNRQRRTRRGSESVASNSRSCAFEVRDATGTITVEPDGAKFVDEKVFSQFDAGAGGSLSFGSFRFTVGSLLMGDRRTIGFRLEESAIPVGRQVYVLGEAVDTDGRLRIQKPAKKGAAFMVSLKSEEQLVKGAKGLSSGLRIAGIVAAAAGAVIIVLWILGVFTG